MKRACFSGTSCSSVGPGCERGSAGPGDGLVWRPRGGLAACLLHGSNSSWEGGVNEGYFDEEYWRKLLITNRMIWNSKQQQKKTSNTNTSNQRWNWTLWDGGNWIYMKQRSPKAPLQHIPSLQRGGGGLKIIQSNEHRYTMVNYDHTTKAERERREAYLK